MPDLTEISDEDFATQMSGLVVEAERALEDRHTPRIVEKAHPEPELEAPAPAVLPPPPALSLAEVLRPLVQGVQAVGRASGEQAQILSRIEKTAVEMGEAQKDLPRIVSDLKGMLEQRNSVSRQMFDALHEELKSYKDGFLLDTVHRPMIRDLITLYDDLTLIHQQMDEPVTRIYEVAESREEVIDLGKRLESIHLHIEHNLEFILEVLARLEVQQLPPRMGKLDKRTQRAVAVEAAEDPDEDLHVVRTLRRGFLWKDRVVRAEEVVIKKWKEGFLMALKTPED